MKKKYRNTYWNTYMQTQSQEKKYWNKETETDMRFVVICDPSIFFFNASGSVLSLCTQLLPPATLKAPLSFPPFPSLPFPTLPFHFPPTTNPMAGPWECPSRPQQLRVTASESLCQTTILFLFPQLSRCLFSPYLFHAPIGWFPGVFLFFMYII